jgi:hypothetical protein
MTQSSRIVRRDRTRSTVWSKRSAKIRLLQCGVLQQSKTGVSRPESQPLCSTGVDATVGLRPRKRDAAGSTAAPAARRRNRRRPHTRISASAELFGHLAVVGPEHLLGLAPLIALRCAILYRRALERNASSRWHRTEKSVAMERYETAKESILDSRTGDHIMSPSKPITRGADISVLVIIAGLYLGLFLTRNVEQYQNQKLTDVRSAK